jgi:hypothetical protein
MKNLIDCILRRDPNSDDIRRHKAEVTALRESLIEMIYQDTLSGHIADNVSLVFENIDGKDSYRIQIITQDLYDDVRISVIVKDDDGPIGAVLFNLRRKTVIHNLPEDIRNRAGLSRLMRSLIEIDVHYEYGRKLF